ncbi:serine/threonine protein kinase [Streptomyces sp. IMTB 2501]|uniref:serine/threonine-protein kinase n=1 Tax=Streptomyces sp. IMTB 2501 TaxID=1776340 RepID=UPI000970140B|nr:serine/threonine-protein kinase [Streptomyces sp. IMTB 2501]OLZ64387.1 serine/threonine protein kinase [Streptomyces sp. IMTB 2501]
MEKLGAGDPPHIGGYRLLARLGAGGMGQVYLARSERGRTVAVKLVREELAAQEEFRARFRQEVQAARRVGGYWTAPVLDADTEAPVPWVATGYVAGPSLQQVVGHDHGALPERSVRILAAGLAHALKDIHAAGIVHRDLKPSNVLVTIDGPRVIDFGIARALETTSPGGEGLTRTGSLVGSPGFMAPEQVRGDRITPACDVFCLGSMLAYAATGAMPFGTADSGAHALMFRIAQEEPDLAGVPEGIADLVRDCLRKDPGARPSLDALLERTGAEDTVSGGRSRDPWLPGALVAQLGRHAVQLLEVEDPEGEDASGGGAPSGAGAPEGTRPPAGSGFPAVPAVPPSSGADGGASEAGREGVPEHAAVSDAPVGGVEHLPTVVSGQAPPVAPGFGYGYAQQHPQSGGGAYGYPQQAGGQQPYPSYGGAPEAERRSGRSTALLVVVALVVALGAGGSVYALMNNGGGGHAQGGGKVGPAPTTTPDPTASTPSDSASASAPTDGDVPGGYLGTWKATIDSDAGINTRQLTIRQGKVGDSVLTLIADGPTNDGGMYHCVFEARLTRQPGADGTLEIGPSTVTSGEPATSCTPGEATEVTLLPSGSLKRAKASGGESLTYTRQ